jgi:hypothetical protein
MDVFLFSRVPVLPGFDLIGLELGERDLTDP